MNKETVPSPKPGYEGPERNPSNREVVEEAAYLMDISKKVNEKKYKANIDKAAGMVEIFDDKGERIFTTNLDEWKRIQNNSGIAFQSDKSWRDELEH